MSGNDGPINADKAGTGSPLPLPDEAISRFVLSCVKALHDSHPQPVDVAALATKAEMGPAGDRVLSMLRDFGFISGPSVQTVLTLSGLKSLRTASQSNYKVAQLLSGQPVSDPNRVLLAIMRAGFNHRSKFCFMRPLF